jgi:hypothetical protein
MRDYFSPDATYTYKRFRRRFRMQKDLFLTIRRAVEEHGVGSSFEDERDMFDDFRCISNGDPVVPEHDLSRIDQFFTMHQSIKNKEAHTQLQADLVEHLRRLHDN